MPLPKNIACKYKQENENEVASYKLVYHVPVETAYNDYERIVTAFESYYQAVKKGMTQAEICYTLYRELAKRTVYDENTESRYQRTACGAVLDGKDICEDFSISYKQLMHGAGDASSVQKIGAAPSPGQPLRPIADVPNQVTSGMTALRTEIMFSKMKDAYFHGTESYFTVQNPDRQCFRTQIEAAEEYVKTASADDGQAEVLYNQLRQARLDYGGQPIR